ncbi:hypothetical protein A4A49_05009 [Nicotiana attenuata]|uniref:Serine-rich protein-like protein n=1 Tax=Nicotiana attenuata TaxID=49451 RepID=A0A1J6IFE5_NICAT|nr:hypothetical protein A4A49_05009 [Nicotiana attenuata]
MAEQPQPTMAEQSVHNIEQTKKKKLNLPHICLEAVKNSPPLPSSTPSSPSALRKASSVKYSCLCSPTTHAGSFRCRYHRNAALTRTSMSVGSKLSELATGKQCCSDSPKMSPGTCRILQK